ncbi:precorrin-6A/cobalt-precorrin-6A reductase [Tropicibacter oceani]|uniref:Precorrin-6A/cobalt-precorrin-6A reductase n=1 Tax=Tropicibacter oceani TaxID=3058420 RepID=A0ABY8QF44_9RHOB|nr:precorrin-6A/cobalt-precorrin-6A reductase [Tropicibacter oceani]WGW03225.1 precorrin-6A/cobalt-precorrin-6A reductase [Tropicibacter oceani]
MTEVVIIGGSAEALGLARALPGAQVRLPVRERVAMDWPVAPERGPVTADWLAGQGARIVIEAAHPCDDTTAFAVARACDAAGIVRLQLVRPEWRAGPRDRWVALRRPQDAARVIPKGARVLITTGRDILPAFRALGADCLVRRIGHARLAFPLQRGRFLYGAGPFTVAHETALLRKERIDWLLVRNAGGTGGWPKLEAARRLGLPVAMIDRPRRPGGPRVETVKEALEWLKRH